MLHTPLDRRLATWTALVVVCAIPLFVTTPAGSNTSVAAFQAAKVLGVAVWIAVMVGLDTWWLRRGRVRASQALARGAAAFAVIQAVVALVSRNALFYVYWPAALLLMATPTVVAKSRVTFAFYLTVTSGLSALLAVILLTAICYLLDRRRTFSEGP